MIILSLHIPLSYTNIPYPKRYQLCFPNIIGNLGSFNNSLLMIGLRIYQQGGNTLIGYLNSKDISTNIQ